MLTLTEYRSDDNSRTVWALLTPDGEPFGFFESFDAGAITCACKRYYQATGKYLAPNKHQRYPRATHK